MGLAFAPRPATDIPVQEILQKANELSRDTSDIPPELIGDQLRAGCMPVLAGQSRVNNSLTWAIRLKPPHRRYPWIAVWVDQNNNHIVAWKRWDRPGRRAIVVQQSCANICP
ncbi:MAG: hypothetical protein ACOX3G_07200 [Armatimonadota bacterium]